MPQPTVRRSLEATFDERRTMETYRIPLGRPGVTSQGVECIQPSGRWPSATTSGISIGTSGELIFGGSAGRSPFCGLSR
jgi:hypothetical protein